jgi:hypothetical protein
MRAVWLTVMTIFTAGANRNLCQAEPPAVTTLPPSEATLPNGIEVSQPLSPVLLPVSDVPPFADPLRRVEEVREGGSRGQRGPLGPSWSVAEFLLWWPKAHPLPPLVTTARLGPPPALGDPNGVVAVGGRALAHPDVAGGRFILGCSLGDPQDRGAELVYFFLGSRTIRSAVTAIGNPRVASIGLAYVDPRTGREEVFPAAAPGVATGAVVVTATTRVQGAEGNLVANLLDTPGVQLNGLLGYRFLQVHEGVTLEQVRCASGGCGPIYDEFDGHNRFHGGQLGLQAGLSRGGVFLELTGKVALGRTFEVVRIDGVTGFLVSGPAGSQTVTLPGGVYTSPANIGRHTSTAFAVVPEGVLKVGLRFNQSGRLYVGYNLLYLSDAVRPGDQIDRNVNPANIAALNPGGGYWPPDRPRPLLSRSDFWAQGLIIGLEARY